VSPRRRSAALLARAQETAAERDGVVSRRELAALGLDRFAVRDMVSAGRWRVLGRQTVCVHTGELSALARWWWAVIEAGPEIAALDGVSALMAAGARHLSSPEIHLSVRHASRPLPVRGVRIHQVRKWERGDVTTGGVPRVRPEVAAIRAAHWAVSDRQAALFLCVAVQQRIVSPDALQRAARRITGRRRRAFVRRVVADLVDGAHSLGELDFARLCRERGLPEPSRQVVRRGPRGKVYLDVRWDALKLVVEIDGSQHTQGLSVSDDNLRANAVAIRGDTVLRIDLVGLRVFEHLFMDQICEAHRVLGGGGRGRVA
jgi:very-short-patch-repair endonuclease